LYLICKIRRLKFNYDAERVKILLSSDKSEDKKAISKKIQEILLNFGIDQKITDVENRLTQRKILKKQKNVRTVITNSYIKSFRKKILKIAKLYAEIDEDGLGFVIDDDEDVDFLLYDTSENNKYLISPVIEKVEFIKKEEKVHIETILEEKEIDYIINELIEKDKIKYKLPTGYEIDVPSYLEKSPFTPMIIEKIQYNEEFRQSSRKIIENFSKKS